MSRKEYMTALSVSLKRQRKLLGLTQADVAVGIGVSPGAVSQWEMGRALMGAHSRDSLRTFFKEEWARQEKVRLDAKAAEECGSRCAVAEHQEVTA